MDLRKRFYTSAVAAALENGFTVELDGRPLRTPAGHGLCVPTHPLAEALATEWQGQGENIDPSTMPMTEIANTAIDKIAAERDGVEQELLKYAATDLLCYRADTPEDLALRQHEHWQPLLDWATKTCAAELLVTTGILPVAQPPNAIAALHKVIGKFDNLELAAVASLTADCGSLIVALAISSGHIDHAQACQAVQLDESYQNERWGVDEEAEHVQQRQRRRIAEATLFLEMARK